MTPEARPFGIELHLKTLPAFRRATMGTDYLKSALLDVAACEAPSEKARGTDVSYSRAYVGSRSRLNLGLTVLFCKWSIAALALALAGGVQSATAACLSSVTLTINSSNYRGQILVEFRQGSRPGSKLVRRTSIDTRGTVSIEGVCPGTYFFSFSTPSDDTVSVTRYFNVTDDGDSYNNPSITVTYARSSSGGQRVGSARKGEL